MAKIGYYNMEEGQGAAYQGDLISDIGQTGLQLTTLGDLGASAVVYLDNPSNFGYNSDFLANESNLMDFVEGGGVLVMHDRFADGSFVAGYTHGAEGPYSTDVDFVNDTGRVADGPYGTLTDFSLDGYNFSNHGVADISDWQDSRIFVITTSMDPTKLVTIVQAIHDGELIYSTIPTDYWVGTEHDASMTAYMENLLSYAVTLHNLTTTHLGDTGDTLDGSKTADKIFAGAGEDQISGKAGDDLIDGAQGDDRLIGSKGDDVLWGGDGVDLLKGGTGNDQLWGQELRDKLNGGDGDDYMVGGTGNDVLNGGDGNDTAIGGSGYDVIDGGSGFDKISGGKGADTMTGGDSADIFFFGPADSPTISAHDLVTDFVHGQDLVDLTAYNISDWSISTSSSFSHTAHEILIYDAGGNTTAVKIDLDGDANADAIIELHSDSPANQADVTDFQYSFPT